MASVIEERISVAVRVPLITGPVDGRVQVTIFRKAGVNRAQPFIVLLHGRATQEFQRAALDPGRYADNARYFAERGFVVAVPARIGYGPTGGPDIEDTGRCYEKRYFPAYDAGAAQAEQVIAALRRLPYVNPNQGVLVGQSFGGALTLATAARGIPGVRGSVNFAGGAGGRPLSSPGEPCAPDRLERVFGAYGRQVRVPTLWLYSENDRFMGQRHPRNWHRAFTAAGGRGRFVQLPSFGADGHASFQQNPAAWRPSVEAFLRQLGLLI